MIDVRRGADRYGGGDPDSGITTLHAFSFGRFYDPDNVRFGPVLACNEETLPRAPASTSTRTATPRS